MGTALERRDVHGRLVSAWYRRIGSSKRYKDVQARCDGLASDMRGLGYDVSFLDEDGETMVVYGVALRGDDALTIHAYWDDDDGGSISCLLSGPRGAVTLAMDERQQLVEGF